MNKYAPSLTLRRLLENYGVNDEYPVQSRVTLGGNSMLTFKVPLGDRVIDMFVDLADVKEHQFINAIVKQVFERGVDMGKHLKAEEIISALGMEKNVEGPMTLPRIAEEILAGRRGEQTCIEPDIVNLKHGGPANEMDDLMMQSVGLTSDE